jgi:hypothetical protein
MQSTHALLPISISVAKTLVAFPGAAANILQRHAVAVPLARIRRLLLSPVLSLIKNVPLRA